MTQEEWDVLCYRRVRLNNKLRQLSGMISARWGDAAESVRRDGVFSQTAAEETVAALMSAKDMPECGRDREFYEDLLYCALRILEAGTGWMHWTDGKSWDDLVDLVEQFPAIGEEAYQALTGDTSDPWEPVDEDLEALIRDVNETVDEAALQEQEAAGMVEVVDADDAVMEQLERENEIAEWKEAFGDEDKAVFCERYRRCRACKEHIRYWQQVRYAVDDMVDAYLFDRGQSGFLSDDFYFLAYGLLDKAQVQLRALQGEAAQ